MKSATSHTDPGEALVEQVLKATISKLRKHKEFDTNTIKKLRELGANSRLVEATVIVRVLEAPWKNIA